MLDRVDRHGSPTTQSEVISPFGLAAMAAVLHLAVLAARVPHRSGYAGPAALLSWVRPPEAPEARDTGHVPSNPTRSYCAGRLELTAGMAVLVLTMWLHIMRIHGSHAD